MNRSARFLARVDDYVPRLTGAAARRAFLQRQIEAWEARYTRFIASEGRSEVVVAAADPPDATDFVLTISGLAARRASVR